MSRTGIVQIGAKVGHLEVLEELEYNKYICKCDCGAECIKSIWVLGEAIKQNKDLFCSTTCEKRGIGVRSGHLVVIGVEQDRRSGSGAVMCTCKCDCGNIVQRPLNIVLRGKAKCCNYNCIYRKPHTFDVNDCVGKRFGRLKVLEFSHRKPYSRGYITYYTCICDCGNIAIVGRHNLLSGNTKSCGCLFRNLNPEEEDTKLAYLKADKQVQRNNTSGTTGVSYDKRNACWLAYIGLKNKVYIVGRYKNKQDAIDARVKAMEEYWKPINEAHGESLYGKPKDKK